MPLFFFHSSCFPFGHIFRITRYVAFRLYQGKGVSNVRISDLQAKDIVNMNDGKKMGNLHDLEIDMKTGKILGLVIAAGGRWPSLFQREDEITVPWNRIEKIGTDIIFVDHRNMPLRTIYDEVDEK